MEDEKQYSVKAETTMKTIFPIDNAVKKFSM